MNSSSDYKVSFGRIARTLLYEDSQGIVRFTFDIDTSNGQKLIILEKRPLDTYGDDRLRADLIFERTKQYLLLCGYQVEVFEK